MIEITFGIPPRRMRKEEEKYTFPVLTMEARPEVSGRGYKFNFNKAAQKFLELDPQDRIAFSFLKDGTILIASLIEEDNPHAYKITNTFTFSNSKLHNFLNKKLETDGKEVEFRLENYEIESNYNVAKLRIIKNESILVPDSPEFNTQPERSDTAGSDVNEKQEF